MDRIKLIESYLDGSMSQVDRERFEKSLSEDHELASELALSKDVNKAILDEGTVHFRKVVRKIIEKKTDKANKLLQIIKYPLAAAIALLVGLSLWQVLSSKESPSELYLAFYNPYQIDLSTRSVERSADKVEIAYLLYQEGDYESSFEILKNYLNKNYDNLTAHYYLGLNAIELKLYSLAIEELQLVGQDSSTPFALHAQWYAAITYLQLNQPDKARRYLTILAETENMYSQKAKTILKKLKS
jgi:hypothetical protein